MLKKTIIAAALISSSLVAGQAFAGNLTTLMNVNHSKQFLAIGGPGACSFKSLGESGVVAPGQTNTSHSVQIYAVCGGKLPCTTTIYAFPTDPIKAGKTSCTDGSKIVGISTLTGSSINIFSVAGASIAFKASSITNWNVTPMSATPTGNTITFTISNK